MTIMPKTTTKTTRFPLRRALAAALLPLAALGATLAPLAEAQAAAPAQQRSQVPGYYRAAFGDFEVTALFDGVVPLAPGLLKGLAADEIQTLLARMFLETTPGVQTAVNAFLIHTGQKLVLVDAGAAACFGPTLGRIQDNLKAAGYRPEQVDTVLLTHMHADHLCGLRDAQGRAAFPNATVRVAARDAGFWLDEKTAASAPKEMQGFFRMASEAVAPYREAGRLSTFEPGEVLLPGVTAMATNGHTPGHSAFLFESQGRRLLVWGDLVHSHAVQFARPAVSIEFDSDPAQAIATRRQVFEQAASQGWSIAGAHLPFPGLGRVGREGATYRWVPAEFGPLPAATAPSSR